MSRGKCLKLVSIFLVILLVALCMFSGCSTGKQTVSSDQSGTQAVQSGQETKSTAKEGQSNDNRSVVMLVQQEEFNSLDKVAQRFEAKTGIKVDFQVLPGGGQFYDIMRAKANTGELPDLLCYAGDVVSIRGLNPDYNLLDLTNEPYIEKFAPIVNECIEYGNLTGGDGKIYGIPYTNNGGLVLYYNKKIFSDLKLSVPNTYDDFLNVCEVIKKAGIDPLCEAGQAGWPMMWYFYIASANSWDKGTDTMDKLNKNEIQWADVPEVVQIFKDQLVLRDKGYYNKDMMSMTFDMQREYFANGKAAMMIHNSYNFMLLKEAFPDIVKDLAMAPMPYKNDNIIPNVGVGGAIVASRYSKNVDLEKQFLEFFTSDENLTAYYTEMGLPSLYNVKVSLGPEYDDTLIDALNNHSTLAAFNKIQASIGTLHTYEQDLFLNVKTPEQVVKVMDEEWQKSGKASKLPGF